MFVYVCVCMVLQCIYITHMLMSILSSANEVKWALFKLIYYNIYLFIYTFLTY